MRYLLSKILPVPMRSSYTRGDNHQRERATWVQWRGRAFRVHVSPVA